MQVPLFCTTVVVYMGAMMDVLNLNSTILNHCIRNTILNKEDLSAYILLGKYIF